jgi:3-hydroxyisobutyrate dehydrogenase-like beta-hydroxyacid dehydrogenase
VYNRTASRADALGGQASAAASPREAVAGAEVAVTMLADEGAVEEVVFGSLGFFDALAPGAVHVSIQRPRLGGARQGERAEHRPRAESRPKP